MWDTLWQNFLQSLYVHLPFALLAFVLGWVSLSGFLGGLAVGWLVFLGLGWRGWLVLAGFFALGTGVTRLGYRRKEVLGLAQEESGRRGSRHVAANCALATLLALAALVTGDVWRGLLTAAFVGALATATLDTGASELGQLYGKRPVLITTFRRVEPGTAGAVSWQGTLGGILMAALLGVLAAAVGLIPWPWAWIPPAAGLIGGSFESFLGALVPSGRLSNEIENFLNTVVAAAAALLLTLV
ncbi:MAG TPA: DUF92 domain-containing protein [Candidatus Coatesbacteria bacterium]|nr:DUF92 domain-containing protein [Candidatus Coatesbacteria bacterium]